MKKKKNQPKDFTAERREMVLQKPNFQTLQKQKDEQEAEGKKLHAALPEAAKWPGNSHSEFAAAHPIGTPGYVTPTQFQEIKREAGRLRIQNEKKIVRPLASLATKALDDAEEALDEQEDLNGPREDELCLKMGWRPDRRYTMSIRAAGQRELDELRELLRVQTAGDRLKLSTIEAVLNIWTTAPATSFRRSYAGHADWQPQVQSGAPDDLTLRSREAVQARRDAAGGSAPAPKARDDSQASHTPPQTFSADHISTAQRLGVDPANLEID